MARTCCHQRPTHETVRSSAGVFFTIIPSCLSRSRTPHTLAAIDKPIRVVLTKSKMAQPSVTCHSDHASDCFTCRALNSNFHHLTLIFRHSTGLAPPGDLSSLECSIFKTAQIGSICSCHCWSWLTKTHHSFP